MSNVQVRERERGREREREREEGGSLTSTRAFRNRLFRLKMKIIAAVFSVPPGLSALMVKG